MVYDAAGRNTEVTSVGDARRITQTFDGAGQAIKRVEQYVGATSPYQTTYYLRSSVVGGRVVAEYNVQGQRQRSYVYAGGEVLAEQWSGSSVTWRHDFAVTGSRGESGVTGGYSQTVEPDPAGAHVGLEDPFIVPDPGPFAPETPTLLGNFDLPDGRCTLDGLAISCGSVSRLLESGAAMVEWVSPFIGAGGGGFTYQLVQTWEDWSAPGTGNDDIGAGTTDGGTTGTRLVERFIAIPNTGSLGTQTTPPQTGRAPLQQRDAERYENERLAALGRLAFSMRCRDFLSRHGIDVRALIGAVRSQRPYDGTRSTISRRAAGLVDPNNSTDVRFGTVAVNSMFRSGGGTNAATAIYPGGTLGATVLDRSDVYYRPSRINHATILHEALHSLLGETDTQLQLRLGLSTQGLSGNITQALRDNGCAEQE